MGGKLKTRLSDSISFRIDLAREFHNKKPRLGLSWQDFRRLKIDNARPDRTVRFRERDVKFTSAYWFLHSINEIFVDGVYKFEPERSEAHIIDCGANIGLSVLYFKHICPNARVIAFEPDPTIFGLAQENIREFQLANVELINKAVWIDESYLNFASESALGGRLGSVDEESSKSIKIESVRLRDYLENKVDFLKIDIEGAEYEVLKDCRDRLQNVENLFVEYHVLSNEEQRLTEILEWIKQAGFRFYISEAAKNQLHPFVSKKGEVYEMQLNISCYRP